MRDSAFENSATARSPERLSKPCGPTTRCLCSNVALPGEAERNGLLPPRKPAFFRPSLNAGYRMHYLRLVVLVEACFILICKKVKRLAVQDRNRFGGAEADIFEKTWREGRNQDLFTIA